MINQILKGQNSLMNHLKNVLKFWKEQILNLRQKVKNMQNQAIGSKSNP